MYRIYINEAALIISESIPQNLENYQEIENQEFNFLLFYKKVKTSTISGVYLLLIPKPANLFKEIKKSFQIIKAAGGLVSNEENKYLFIFRNGKWDLPKGKLDPWEKPKKAARREVEEECGITVTEVRNKICKTWHAYEFNDQQVLKSTAWYHMRAYNQKKLIPQLEEGITKVKWIAPGDFEKIRKNTYPLILDIIGIVED
ncbi:MAG TPA: NUDIX hydrolase [Sphingobacteriaceae bacterium]|nr:NUDIX hydrolase [Sphingobacteriaceae bacterium]